MHRTPSLSCAHKLHQFPEIQVSVMALAPACLQFKSGYIHFVQFFLKSKFTAQILPTSSFATCFEALKCYLKHSSTFTARELISIGSKYSLLVPNRRAPKLRIPGAPVNQKQKTTTPTFVTRESLSNATESTLICRQAEVNEINQLLELIHAIQACKSIPSNAPMIFRAHELDALKREYLFPLFNKKAAILQQQRSSNVVLIKRKFFASCVTIALQDHILDLLITAKTFYDFSRNVSSVNIVIPDRMLMLCSVAKISGTEFEPLKWQDLALFLVPQKHIDAVALNSLARLMKSSLTGAERLGESTIPFPDIWYISSDTKNPQPNEPILWDDIYNCLFGVPGNRSSKFYFMIHQHGNHFITAIIDDELPGPLKIYVHDSNYSKLNITAPEFARKQLLGCLQITVRGHAGIDEQELNMKLAALVVLFSTAEFVVPLFTVEGTQGWSAPFMILGSNDCFFASWNVLIQLSFSGSRNLVKHLWSGGHGGWLFRSWGLRTIIESLFQFPDAAESFSRRLNIINGPKVVSDIYIDGSTACDAYFNHEDSSAMCEAQQTDSVVMSKVHTQPQRITSVPKVGSDKYIFGSTARETYLENRNTVQSTVTNQQEEAGSGPNTSLQNHNTAVKTALLAPAFGNNTAPPPPLPLGSPHPSPSLNPL